MVTVYVNEYFNKRALVTRESGRHLVDSLIPKLKPGDRELSIDFSGIEAVTPSFVDEVLYRLADFLQPEAPSLELLEFLHPPTRLSEKFEAIARTHEVEIEEIPDGWRFRKPAAT